MSAGTTVLLGAIAGLTIFLELPVARLGNLSKPVQGFLNAVAEQSVHPNLFQKPRREYRHRGLTSTELAF